MAESLGVTPPAPAAEAEPTSPFLRACRGLPVERTPVWLLRQAGRYQPEYRALREKHSLLELIRTPELAAQVTLLPVDAFGVDAAIVFSDILPPLVGMGLELDFVKGDGPRIGNPISAPRDVDLLGTPPAEETMAGTLEAIALVRGELEPRDVPVIGFAGAPFTLASYAIEGGTSKDFAPHEGVHALGAGCVEAAARKARHRAGRLPPRAGSSGRPGTPGVRLLGRPRARPRGLPALRALRTTASSSRPWLAPASR